MQRGASIYDVRMIFGCFECFDPLPLPTPHIQRSANVFVRGCEKLVIALAYLFCLAVVGSCLAGFAYFFAGLCTYGASINDAYMATFTLMVDT